MKAEQLRKSILQLAIQGKLVKQDPNDEPASVLLERIRAEKQRLIKEGKIKKDKGDSIIFKGDDNCHYEKIGSEVKNIDDEIDFDLPDGWEYIRLCTVCWLDDIKKSVGEKLPYLDAKTLRGKTDLTYLDEGKIVDVNTKVILVDGENSGEVFDVPFKGYMGSTFKVLGVSEYFNLQYLNTILDFYKDVFRGNKIGAAIPHLNKNLFKSLIIGLPPIKEQERIVEEIKRFSPVLDEYDRLEQQATKLDGEIYDKLKKSILQYAIQGKLVEQDKNDESASILLERIRAEKKAQLGKKYVESYIYKGDDNCYYEKVGSSVKNITDETLFDIPDNWCWTRLNDICDYIHRGKSPTYGSSKILPIMAQKCNQWDKIYTDRCLFAEEKSIERYTDEQFLKLGDIIINSTGIGTVGRTGMIENYVFEKYSKFVADSHVTVVRVNSNLIPKYLYLFLISPQIQVDVESKCSGSTNQIELGTNTIKNYLMPLPPINEQQRIVRVYNKILYKIKDEI